MSVDISNLNNILAELKEYNATLVAVSKKKSVEEIKQVYDAGHKIFGENYVRELKEKYEALPKDIEWHFIGHLQTNKVKVIAPFVSLIQSVDSLKLLKEINKEGEKNNRVINCLLQIHIAQEESKFGLSFEEAEEILKSTEVKAMKNISIQGLMGMASLTYDDSQVKKEFHSLKQFFDKVKTNYQLSIINYQFLSMGMTSDYQTALEEGSTMVRIGSAIFGERI
ncbi:MAG TPA: YggS family pyridoxal phosphate-dependent enzyme [Bacteroidia bacterium]|nr:YggS family pyridoxal phosphate-dependent enzyme [Bacteroidia bacterium]